MKDSAMKATPKKDSPMKVSPMDDSVFQGKWKKLRGSAKQTWGKLTDDDLKRADGGYDKFVGTLQERYGYAREEAEKAIQKAFAAFKD